MQILWLWISLGIIGVIIWILLIKYGIKYCNKNNAIGIVMLFIALNILGLVIGWAILWNNQNILKGNFWKNAEKLSKIREERRQYKKSIREEQNKFTAKKYREWREKRIKEKEEKNKLKAKDYREWREKRIKEKEEKNNN
ncbi:hypothetical protein [Spiroplasma endosymbiont of Amphimallon solstitiale]|uniref:hypothetical protein n=1 Tax=Spiroplasma endosymbiont of Amphimallon solstitiale TaxID=3066288 RepID=UPI00313D1D33